MFGVPIIDEGSTSSKSPKLGAYSNLGDVRRREFKMPNNYERAEARRGFDSPQPKTIDPHDRPSKLCKREGCRKGAHGASGLCIAHGGGRRCEMPDCNKGAEVRTKFCKAHGGGRRCDHLGCIESAGGKTNLCITHDGGRRFSQEGCTKAARGKSGLCIRHGGGKWCREEGCTKSAEGLSGLCISHGGGRCCEFLNCGKGAQGITRLCKAHGGGRRCEYEGCTKGAEGSTRLCKAHGGGKRCTFGGGGICTKSVHGEVHPSVLHVVVVSVAKSRVALQVQEGKLNFVSNMAVEKDANLRNVTRVLKEALIFAKPMVEGRKPTDQVMVYRICKT